MKSISEDDLTPPIFDNVYLDNAATSFPKPESVYVSMDKFARSSLGNPGRGTHRFARESESLIENLRIKFANFFDVHFADRFRDHNIIHGTQFS